jgi:hypothetical protein
MLMGWDLARAGLEEAGQRGTPRVAVALLEEVTYPLEMGSIIEKARSHETSDNAGSSTPQEKHLIGPRVASGQDHTLGPQHSGTRRVFRLFAGTSRRYMSSLNVVFLFSLVTSSRRHHVESSKIPCYRAEI